MKHGRSRCSDSKTPVVGIVTEGRVREKILSNIAESKAREARSSSLRTTATKKPPRSPTTSCGCRASTSLLSPIVNVIPAAAAGLPHRRHRRQRRRPAPQPRQNRHRRITCRVSEDSPPMHVSRCAHDWETDEFAATDEAVALYAPSARDVARPTRRSSRPHLNVLKEAVAAGSPRAAYALASWYLPPGPRRRDRYRRSDADSC